MMAYDAARQEYVLFGGILCPPDGGCAATDETWTYDGRTWTKENPATSPPARFAHSMAYDGARRQVVLFGGGLAGAADEPGTTWTWDGVNWTKHQSAIAPTPREMPTMAYDAARQEVVLFGGRDATCTGTCPAGPPKDTWTWNGRTWTKEQPSASPPGRVQGGMAYDAARERVVLFGGNTGSRSTSTQTWTWDGANWTQEQPASSPDARQAHAMAYDPASERVVVFGGTSRLMDDTWTWDGKTWTEFPRTWPERRWASSAAYDTVRGEVVLFGGHATFNPLFGDTWTWDGTTWTEHHPPTSPPPRQLATMAYDGARERVVLFGGLDAAGKNLGDTWTWNGSTWTEEKPASSPPPRQASGMASDPDTDRIVLFGGCCDAAGNPLGDTWTWNGNTWSEERGTPSPVARRFHPMTHDAARGQIVLFGGLAKDYRHLQDTWTWDRTGRTELRPANSPLARVGASMVYAPAMREAVLFGGENSDTAAACANGELPQEQCFYNDTWTWGGSDWTRIDPGEQQWPTSGGPDRPRQRIWAASAEDRNGDVVLFGGNIGGHAGNDMYACCARSPTQADLPPLTTATLDPDAPNGEAGWYRSPVTVTLTASDDQPGAISTEYRLDAGDWRRYESPFTVQADGEHTASFRSTDTDGNREEPKTRSFKIDRTPPATAASLDPPQPDSLTREGWYRSPVTVTLAATDAASGVAEIRYAIDGSGYRTYTGPFTVEGGGEHTVTYRSRDRAGNLEEDQSVSFKIDRPPARGEAARQPQSPALSVGLPPPLDALAPRTGLRPTRRFLISRRATRLTRRGVVPVRVSCRQRTRCRGTLVLRASARSHQRGEIRSVVLGRRSFRVEAMRRGVVLVGLSASGRRLIARLGRTRVRATATLRRGAAGRRWTARASFRLVGARAEVDRAR